jgi:hypothetical protein
MTNTYFPDAFRSRAIHRRNFIKTISAGAAGAAMIGTGVSSFPNATQAQTSPTLSKFTDNFPFHP